MNRTNEILSFLEGKYGKYVTSKLVTGGKAIQDKNYVVQTEDQAEVMKHIESLCDEQGNKLVPEIFLTNKVPWGMDFSSWLGTLEKKKKFMFIGAEPHLSKNFQLVYDFGTYKEKSIEESAKEHYDRKTDIWSYLTDVFVENTDNENNITEFLSQCYITDLSHIVPKDCGQVKTIVQKLEIKTTEWNKFRTKVATQFLPAEIKAVDPEYIILHGKSAREFFRKRLNVTYDIGQSPYSIDGTSRYKIYVGEFEKYKVIAIPHLKGQVRSELWKSLKYPERPISAKKILRKLVNK